MLDLILAWLADPGHIALIMVAAKVIVAATDTPPRTLDGQLTTWGKIYKLIEIIALSIGKAKQRG